MGTDWLLEGGQSRGSSPMRYSVVLPRIDPKDPEGTRRALETARDLWASGAHGEAISRLKDAADAAKSAGQDDRASSLLRAAAALAEDVGIVAQPTKKGSSPAPGVPD